MVARRFMLAWVLAHSISPPLLKLLSRREHILFPAITGSLFTRQILIVWYKKSLVAIIGNAKIWNNILLLALF